MRCRGRWCRRWRRRRQLRQQLLRLLLEGKLLFGEGSKVGSLEGGDLGWCEPSDARGGSGVRRRRGSSCAGRRVHAGGRHVGRHAGRHMHAAASRGRRRRTNAGGPRRLRRRRCRDGGRCTLGGGSVLSEGAPTTGDERWHRRHRQRSTGTKAGRTPCAAVGVGHQILRTDFGRVRHDG